MDAFTPRIPASGMQWAINSYLLTLLGGRLTPIRTEG
jgi:hypothetical protein